MKKISRRQMLASSATLVSSLVLPSAFASDCCNSKQSFKIGACDWSLQKGSSIEALKVARQLNLDGVQVSLGSRENNMHLRQPQIQQAYKQAVKESDVEIASLAIGALNEVPYKSQPIAEQWVSDSIDVAQAMGTKVVLLAFFGKGDLKNDKPGIDEVVKRLKKVAPKAENKGIYLAIESTLSAQQHLDIIDRVGSSAIKVYYDVGNSHAGGYNIYEEIRLLGDNICEFHAKDYDNIFGRGRIDFPKVRKAMDDIGYKGWIIIEGAHPFGMEKSYRMNEKYLRYIFPRKI